MVENPLDINHLVISLQSKVEKLIIEHKKAQEDLKQIRQENSFLRNNLAQKNQQINELEEMVKVLKLARTLGVKEEKTTDLKLKINELVREIDKCIALVNS